MPEVDDLLQRALEIRDETGEEANTATRVGQFLADLVLFTAAGGSIFNITPTDSLLGIQAGQAYTGVTPAQFLTTMFVRYQAPGFASFALGGQGSRTLRIGTQIPEGTNTFTWSTSNPTNVLPNTVVIEDVTAGTNLVVDSANDGTQTVNTEDFVVANGLSRRYRISADNSEGNTFSALLDINGAPESYFGYSTNGSLTPAQIASLGNEVFQNGRGRTVSGVTATGGQYTYYGYEASAGDLTNIILDGAAPVLGAFTKLGDFPTPNAAGATVTIRLYRSNAVNAFSNNSLAFS